MMPITTDSISSGVPDGSGSGSLLALIVACSPRVAVLSAWGGDKS